MRYDKHILRELRNAKRIIANPHLFSKSLIKTSWLVIKSARKNGLINAKTNKRI